MNLIIKSFLEGIHLGIKGQSTQVTIENEAFGNSARCGHFIFRYVGLRAS